MRVRSAMPEKSSTVTALWFTTPAALREKRVRKWRRWVRNLCSFCFSLDLRDSFPSLELPFPIAPCRSLPLPLNLREIHSFILFFLQRFLLRLTETSPSIYIYIYIYIYNIYAYKQFAKSSVMGPLLLAKECFFFSHLLRNIALFFTIFYILWAYIKKFEYQFLYMFFISESLFILKYYFCRLNILVLSFLFSPIT